MEPGISATSQYILVESDEVPTKEAARALCSAIDRALIQHRLRAVLFDTRGTAQPPADANAAVWEWTKAGKHHDAVAIVVHSDLLKVSANMTALSDQIRLRSFQSVEEAARFLSRSSQRVARTAT